MQYSIVVLKEAAEDARDAYQYYEMIKQGLGDRFLQEVLKRFRDISLHPHYFTFIDEKKLIRDVKLKSFPFVIVYEINNDSVIILAVHNTNRHPDKRFKR